MASSARPVALVTGASAGIGAALRARPQKAGTISCSSRVAVSRWKRSPQNSSQRPQIITGLVKQDHSDVRGAAPSAGRHLYPHRREEKAPERIPSARAQTFSLTMEKSHARGSIA